jgi:CubicO group peptidase (beta-lactamase class C family)
VTDAFKRAARRAKSFRIHAAVFVAVQLLLVVVWAVEWKLGGGTDHPWFLYVLVGWGAALAVHFAVTRDDRRRAGATAEASKGGAKRAVVVLVATLGLLVGATYLFLARPWSNYSLIDMYTLFDADKRVSNFRHMDEIFPSVPISPAPVLFEFPRKLRPLPVTYRFDGEDRTLSGFLKRVSATGILVIKDGTIVYERYFQGASASSRFTSWSMAKSFVGTMVGQALAAGRIDSLDDPITKYVPELAGSGYDGVPIRDVLEMASGVGFDENYDSNFSDIYLFFVKLFLLERSADHVIDDYDSAGPPGKVFSYSSLDTQALGMLVSAVYHRPLAKVLEENLWQPLGARAAYWNTDDSGTPLAFCCLNSRLRDFAKLGQLYLQDGRWQGRRLLPAAWVKRATTPGAPFLEPRAVKYAGLGYGYQWWVPGGSHREYLANGLWGQHVYVSKRDNLVIARTAVDPDSNGTDDAESIAAYRAIAKVLRGRGTG